MIIRKINARTDVDLLNNLITETKNLWTVVCLVVSLVVVSATHFF
jgi:hypothetical protein